MSVKYTQLGVWVKKRLVEEEMTVNELAEELDVSANYLSDVLTGRKRGLKYIDSIVNILTKKGQSLQEVV